MKDRNYAIVFAHLRQHPYVTKEDIALEWSNGRTSSLRELSDKEYKRLISHLRRDGEYTEKLRKARSVVLKLLQEYGIDTRDWGRINAFCSQARIAGKVFAKLRVEELKALSRKMREIISKDKERRNKIRQEAREKHGGNITVITTYKRTLIGEA